MRNEAFLFLSEKERQSKFRAVLKSMTDGGLTDEELQSILLTVSLRQQYSVRVYKDAQEFYQGITPPENNRERMIFGSVAETGGRSADRRPCKAEPAAALVKKRENGEMIQQIYIFVPPERLKKGFRKR